MASRTLSVAVVLPLVLNRFTAEEASVWYLLQTFVAFQILFDIGFSPTFVRVIAYAMGGAQELSQYRNPTTIINQGTTAWIALDKIHGTMSAIYLRLSLGFSLLMGVLGTLSLWKPIHHLEDPTSAWIAWGVILGATGILLRGNTWSCYLQGTGHVALVKRWESIMAAAGAGSAILVLLFNGGILALALITQLWTLLNVLRNRILAGTILNRRLRTFTSHGIDREVFAAVWPSTWRSGVGILLHTGLVNISAILYAQLATAAESASYLLNIRLFTMLTTISNAPFYSRLPRLAKLYVTKDFETLLSQCRRGMALTLWTFAIGFVVLLVSGNHLMGLIKSNVPFPPRHMLTLFGIAFFAERFGAMHLQIHSLSNKILWHVANGITGLICIITTTALYPLLGIDSFAVALLIGCCGFFAPFCSTLSKKVLAYTPASLNVRVATPPLFFILLGLLLTWADILH